MIIEFSAKFWWYGILINTIWLNFPGVFCSKAISTFKPFTKWILRNTWNNLTHLMKDLGEFGCQKGLIWCPITNTSAKFYKIDVQSLWSKFLLDGRGRILNYDFINDQHLINCNIYIQKKSISFGLATVTAWAVIAIIRVAPPHLLTTVGIQIIIVRAPEVEKNIAAVRTEINVSLSLSTDRNKGSTRKQKIVRVPEFT